LVNYHTPRLRQSFCRQRQRQNGGDFALPEQLGKDNSMTEQTAIEKLLMKARFLAAENLEHPEFLEWEKLEKQARKELSDLKEENDHAALFAGKILKMIVDAKKDETA
jgi:hypothetical protein